MDFFTKYRKQMARRIVLPLVLHGLFSVGSLWLIMQYFPNDPLIVLVVFTAIFLIGALFAGAFIQRDSIEPVHYLWDAIQFISPESGHMTAPKLEKSRVGKDMVANLVKQVYQLASVVDEVESTNQIHVNDIHASFVANSLPLPLVVVGEKDDIVFVNKAASDYLKINASTLAHQNVYTALDMSFASEETFEKWLKSARQKNAVADQHWERVRIGLPGQKDSKQFDLAAHYSRGNLMGYETLMVLFDHSEVYSQDDQAMSFVALTVHELRTPLTLLRGYIEVFDEELGPSLNPEMKSFMTKMNAAAQQLTAFVSNILNVAKIEDNQLTLELREENWNEILQNVIEGTSIRARVRGVAIKTDIAENLPAAGVDRYSIYEVLSNLLDNAIKYSKGTGEVYLSAEVNKEGLIETSVKDFGLGIDSSILPHIFDKFYRNHRNRSQIGGTGLGLYLSRAIVRAHGGEIHVRSKVNEGSTFTFTVLPYSHLSPEDKANGKASISRGAHGWIKNHSLYRD